MTDWTIDKIGENKRLKYGDGGSNRMEWEIYIHQNINEYVNDKVISKLKSSLIDLGKKNNDWRENEPIQNIIDPDLFVYKFYEKNNIKDTNNDDEKGYFIRKKYQWLATEFKEDENGKIQILTPIHNISPRTDYQDIYNGIEYVFERMLPLFNKFPAFKERKNKNEFQVIVKSQRYEIEDMSGYSGHWHQEGLTENIIIAGLYYFEKNEGLNGGKLRFRNTSSPSPGYAEYLDDPVVHDTDIEEGTAIVFDNVKLVHRVRMLKNKIGDEQKRYRSFLAFFIVDPENPINSTKTYPSLKKEKYVNFIMENTLIDSKDIASLICEYASCGYTLNEAMEIRKLNIEVRKKPQCKGKWATYHFGNCGEQFWFKHGKAHPHFEGVSFWDSLCWMDSTTSHLSHTSSTSW